MRNAALQVKKERRGKLRSRGQGALHLMLLPSVLLLLIFSYAPMLGLVMAFQNFVPAKGFFGSDWVAWANFEYVFNLPGLWSAIGNTLVISLSKIILGQVLAIFLALMLNEMRKNAFTKSIQTVIYLPHFLSWVIVGGIFLDVLSYDGVVNQILQALGKDPIYFMAVSYTHLDHRIAGHRHPRARTGGPGGSRRRHGRHVLSLSLIHI